MRFNWSIRFETDRRPADAGAGRPTSLRWLYWIGVGIGVLGVAVVVMWKVLGVR